MGVFAGMSRLSCELPEIVYRQDEPLLLTMMAHLGC